MTNTTLKAIHICNSHHPTLQPKIAKEYVSANADRQPTKEHRTHNITWCPHQPKHIES
jgi:hypothetical protein